MPEITATGSAVEEIYLMASFNHWLPVKMDFYEKKLLLLQEPEEIEK